MLIGVISDTHGLLRPEAIAALGGADPVHFGLRRAHLAPVRTFCAQKALQRCLINFDN